MTKRRRNWMLLGAGVPLVLLIAVGVFLATFDGSSYRTTVEQLVRDATGRECSIDGEFEIALSLRPRLRAGGFRLANAAWSESPNLVSVDSVRLELDAWSFVSPPLRIREIDIAGVRVRLETDPEHGPNWVFDAPPPARDDSDDAGGGLLADGLVLDDARLRDASVTYRDAEGTHSLSLDELSASTDGAGHLTFELDGALGTAPRDGAVVSSPLRLGGRVGPLGQLLAAGGIAVEANGNLGDATLALTGSVRELGTLADPELSLELQGPRLEHLGRELGLPALGSGPYHLTARTTPAQDGVDVALDANLDRFEARVTGNVDRLAPPSRVTARVDASGPNLASLGEWLGVEQLPAEPFQVEGGVNHDTGTTTVDGLRVDVGATRLTADGRVGAPPRMTGTDIAFELTGPDLTTWSALATIELPPESYGAAGRVTWSGDGLVLDDVTASVGDNRVRASGSLATVPGLVGTDLTVEGSGPTAAAFADLAGIALPDESFALSGRVRRDQAATTLTDVRARLGDTEVHADGTFGDPPALAGTELDVHATGPELKAIGDLIGVPLFGGAFAADGRITLAADGLGLHEIDARLDENTATVADGSIGWGSGGLTLQFDAHATGPDLAALLAEILETYAKPLPFPARPFDVEGWFRMDSSGYHAKNIEATVGDVAFELTGDIGREPELDGLDATLRARAESLALLAEYVDLPQLPEGVVKIAGRVTSVDGVYTLHDVRGRLDENRFTVDGSLGRLVDAPDGIDATFDVAGPDLSAFAALSPDFALPGARYRTAGHVAIDETGFQLTGVKVELGAARARLEGHVGPLPDLHGTDLAVDGTDVLLGWFEGGTGRELPEEPAWIKGRIGRDPTGFRLDRVEAGLGEHRVSAHGTLGEPPRFEGTALSVEAKGPDLAPWALLADRDDLPDDPYDLTARFDGTPEAFTLHDFALHLGPSDLSGELTLDLRDTPTVSGGLTSHHLDLSGFVDEPAVDGASAAAETTAASGPSDAPQRGKRKLVFSDEPFDLSALGRVNAEVRLHGDSLRLNGRELTAVDIGVKVQDGALTVDPLKATDAKGGYVSGTLSLEPVASGYRVAAGLSGAELRLGVLGHNPADSMLQPPARVEITLAGSGKSAHELVSDLDGHVWLTQGPGQIDNKALGLLSADLLFEIFSKLNPFAKEDPLTQVQCGVYVLDIENGQTTIEAIALRTDKMTMGGRGRIDLGTEKLDISWTSKPRKGVGLSASAITNSYIRLGGSLGNPNIEIKPLEATVTTGAAIATMGLSLVARGMWDRATSGKNVCKKGMKQIEKMMAEPPDEN